MDTSTPKRGTSVRESFSELGLIEERDKRKSYQEPEMGGIENEDGEEHSA